MVLLMVVWIGILVPCLTVAFSLFCVTTRGLESNFPTPLASDAVMKKSSAKFGERNEYPKPLVGVPADRLVLSGMPEVIPLPEVPLLLPTVTGDGGMPAP